MSENEKRDDETQPIAVLTEGTMVCQYRIENKIDSGGMGEVYLAKDVGLYRLAALKFLRHHLCEDVPCRARFVREAQAAAQLSHPNVITIYDVGEYCGRPFIAMEYVDGRTVRDRLSESPMSIAEVTHIARGIADGLRAAHSKGIIHRDIKPANVLIADGDRPKLADFGIAAIAGTASHTAPGSLIGTLGYMSPEQALGQSIDERSDLFSFGILLYEMVSGENPFSRESPAATLRAIIDVEPKPIEHLRPDIDDVLCQVTHTLLRKEPSRRFQSASALCSELLRTAGARRETAASVRQVIAVLPFENLGGKEDDDFADGITDEIMCRLGRISSVGVISRTSTMKYRTSDKSLRQIGRELGAGYILEGTVRFAGAANTKRVRINTRLIRVADDTHVWAETFDKQVCDSLVAQSSVAEQVARAMDVSLSDSEKNALAQHVEVNPDAYKLYLAAMKYGYDPVAVRFYEQAIALDPSFAIAYAALSKTHSGIYLFASNRTDRRMHDAKEAAENALRLDPDLPEAHLALGYYHYWCLRDDTAALSEFEKARIGLPNDVRVMEAEALIWRKRGRFRDAIRQLDQALLLNPYDDELTFCLGETHCMLRQYDDAIHCFDMGVSIRPDDPLNYYRKSWAMCMKGEIVEARIPLEEAPTPDRNWQLSIETLTWIEYELLLRDLNAALKRTLSWPETSFIIAERFWVRSQIIGLIHRYAGSTDLSRIAFQESLGVFDKHCGDYGSIRGYMNSLAIAYAGLGRYDEAVELGERALGALNQEESAIAWANCAHELAKIYVMVGQPDKAIGLLDKVLNLPCQEVSVSIIRAHPHWDPLRNNQRFLATLEKHESGA